VLREIAPLSNLQRVCGDCANEFVVPQQAARTSFPELGRTEYLMVYAFKCDSWIFPPFFSFFFLTISQGLLFDAFFLGT
jgi:hypothetical protein